MTIENTERTVTSTGLIPAPGQTNTAVETVRTDSHVTTSGPARPELGRRLTVLVFGVIQLLIGARFVLLLLDAREGNGLVSAILNLSQLFVGPFEGILRTDALHAGGSTLDVAAILAIAGWTIVEFVVIKALAVFRHETV